MIPVGRVPLELVGEFLGGSCLRLIEMKPLKQKSKELVRKTKELVRKRPGAGPEPHHFPRGAVQVSLWLEHAVITRVRLVIVLIGLLLIAFLIWASVTQLEEVARGDGRIVPSAKVQVLHSPEGGVVKEVLVKRGDLVSKGDVLIRLDDTGFSSNLGELIAKQLALEIARERLEFQSVWPERGEELTYTAQYQEQASQVVAAELSLFQVSLGGLREQVAIKQSRVAQRIAELEASRSQKRKLIDLLQLANEERDMKAPLAEKQIIPRTDMLKLQREIGDLEGQINTLQVAEGRLEAAVEEAEQEIESLYADFRQAARTKLSEVQAQLDTIAVASKLAGDTVDHAVIRAPIDGIVVAVNSSRVGDVAPPVHQLVTIAPVEGNLRVEARVKPQDIAYIHQGQSAL